jgi:hypothetical protein
VSAVMLVGVPAIITATQARAESICHPAAGLRAATGARRELQREKTAPSELAGKRRPAARLRFRQPVPRPGAHRRSRSSRPQHSASPPRACRRTVASGNSASIARPVTSAGG